MVDIIISKEGIKKNISTNTDILEVRRLNRKKINRNNEIEYIPFRTILITFTGTEVP